MSTFYRKHIPGAQKFDIMKDVQNTELFPRNVPDPESFQCQAKQVGVNNGSHVVVYDNTPFCGYFVGSRAWWLFKVNENISLYLIELFQAMNL